MDLGDDIVSCGPKSIILDAGNTGATYEWQDGSIGQTFESDQPGIYWVDVKNSCGTIRDSLLITSEDLPTVDLGENRQVCAQHVILNATSSGAIYEWQNGSTEPTFTANKTGIYWVEVKNICGTIKDTVEITFEKPPFTDLGEDRFICNEFVLLDVTASNATYEWQDGSNESTFTANQSGTYWVEAKNSCRISRDTITVTFEALPTVYLGENRQVCDQHVILNARSSSSGATYQWQDGSTEPIFTANKTGSYWVEVKNICGMVSDTVEIIFENLPSIDLGGNRLICKNFLLDAMFPGASYEWQDGSTEATFNAFQSGTYWVKVKNSCGIAFDSVSLSLNKIENPFIPNVFTPNGDLYNQYFEIDERLLGSKIKILNRWGKVVHESPSYIGNWGGSDLPQGTYFYMITDNCDRKYKGWVTIL